MMETPGRGKRSSLPKSLGQRRGGLLSFLLSCLLVQQAKSLGLVEPAKTCFDAYERIKLVLSNEERLVRECCGTLLSGQGAGRVISAC